MVDTNRDEQLKEIDASIASIENEKVQIKKYVKVAEALSKLQETEEYQLVFDQAFFEDEGDRAAKQLAGDEHLSAREVEILNSTLSNVRGLKVFLKGISELKSSAAGRLAMCDAKIAEEVKFKDDVFKLGGGN